MRETLWSCWRLARFAAPALFFLAALGPRPAQAHPHVWVDVEVEAEVVDGALVALRQRWYFDPMFSNLLMADFDSDGDQVFNASEVGRLRDTVFAQLKSAFLFTDIRLGGERLSQGEATGFEAWYIPETGEAEIAFTLPLANPAALDQGPLRYAVYDPTIYVWFMINGADALALDADTGGACAISHDPEMVDHDFGAVVSSGLVSVGCGGS